MENEKKWKTIPLTDGKYEASNIGEIRRISSGRILRVAFDYCGYPMVCIKYNGKVQSICVHRLIIRTFLGKRRGKQVNHIDGIKTNNSINNLEYVTSKENINHAFDIGLTKTRKPVLQFDQDMNLIKEWPSVHSVRGSFNFGHVSNVCTGRERRHAKFIWKFKSEYHV